jgi:large subunit ribosomal protein MRP49
MTGIMDQGTFHAGPHDNSMLSLFRRKFWRNCLPRLKYHNPAVPMTVNRTNNQEGPALMTIYFTTPEAAENTKTEIPSTTQPHTSTAPVAASQHGPSTERTEVINMKHRLDSEILDQLMSLTKARAVRATAEELREIQEMEEQNARSERDALKMAEVNEKRKREEAILTQARGEVEASMG